MPVRAAAVASAAVTVVLPTPPLPATITTREAAQKRSRSMATDATGVPIARRLRRGVALLAIVVAVSVLALDALAGAATPPVGKRGIDVVQVEGYLDPPNVSLILDAIKASNEHRSTLLILQVKSDGGIDTDIEQVVRAIHRSRVPVAVWVGPSGSDAKGAATILLQAAHLAYISPGSGAGPGQPVKLDDPGASTRAGVADQLAALARRNGRDPDGARKLAGTRLGSSAARGVGATNGVRVDHRRAHRAAQRQEGHHRGG